MKKKLMKRLLLSLAVLSLSFGTSCANNGNSNATAKALNDEQPAVEASAPAEANDAVLKSIPASVAPADAFKTIAAQYAGSVVFVDLWATWCPPCRMAMKKVDEFKPAMKTKGCKFVYITGTTSERADFDAMYKNIDGDHFYLTEAQYGGIVNQFQVEGIPHYIILNKKGEVVWQHKGYPGNEEAINQIEMALAQ